MGARRKGNFKFTERYIQDVLEREYLKNPEYVLRNLYVFGWESDFLAKTRSGYWYEVEIKVSLSDFKNDAKHKRNKFDILREGYYVSEGMKVYANRPNYFSYCVPPYLVDDVLPLLPKYVGLYIVNEYGSLSCIKCPNEIHSCPLCDECDLNLTKKFYYNYKSYEMKYANYRDEIDKLRSQIRFLKSEYKAVVGESIDESMY